jgi:hypothetical protein
MSRLPVPFDDDYSCIFLIFIIVLRSKAVLLILLFQWLCSTLKHNVHSTVHHACGSL